MSKILLVEDDPVLSKSLEFNIRSEGHHIVHTHCVSGAWAELAVEKFDLITLDVELPDGNGIEFCRNLRSKGHTQPILLLTAQSSEDSVVEGLSVGANDYIKKPFSMREFLARLQVHLKGPQTKPGLHDKAIEFCELRINPSQRRIFYGTKELKLNSTKFDILYFLVSNPEKLISRDGLLQYLKRENEVYDRTIDAHISQIRRVFKTEGIQNIQITSIYGSGYKLESI